MSFLHPDSNISMDPDPNQIGQHCSKKRGNNKTIHVCRVICWACGFSWILNVQGFRKHLRRLLDKNIFLCHKKLHWTLNGSEFSNILDPDSDSENPNTKRLQILVSLFQDEQQGWNQKFVYLYGVNSDGRRILAQDRSGFWAMHKNLNSLIVIFYTFFLDPYLRQTKPNLRDASATLKTTLRTRNYRNS
jgi:hypothetical protein